MGEIGNRKSDLVIVYKIPYMFVYLQKYHICFIFNNNLIILFDFVKKYIKFIINYNFS